MPKKKIFNLFSKIEKIIPSRFSPVQAVVFGSAFSCLLIPVLYFVGKVSPLISCLVFILAFLFLASSFINPLFLDEKKFHKREFFYGFGLLFLLLSFFMVPPIKKKSGFDSVRNASSLGARLEAQNIEMENKNPIKPVYEDYYRSLDFGFFSEKINTFLQSFRLRSKKVWSVHSFVKSLGEVNQLRKKQNLPTSNFIQRVALQNNSKIIIWGDLQGAFSSLSRDLNRLQELNVIDENFKLLNVNDYIVFNGDCVSRSPFQLETLTLIFNVLFANPENAFYMKGNHESDNYWHGFGLKTELQMRAAKYWQENERMPLEREVDQVFSNLPLALYFAIPGEPVNDFIRVSHYGAGRNPVLAIDAESKFYKFLTASSAVAEIPFITINDVREEPGTEKISLRAIIKSEKKRDTYQDMDGMRLLDPEGGVTSWTLISCPTEVYQKGLKFFYDSFAIITADNNLDNWKITLHKQDIRTKTGFQTRENFFFTGQNLSGQPQQFKAPVPIQVQIPLKSPVALAPVAQPQQQVLVEPQPLAQPQTEPKTVIAPIVPQGDEIGFMPQK